MTLYEKLCQLVNLLGSLHLWVSVSSMSKIPDS